MSTLPSIKKTAVQVTKTLANHIPAASYNAAATLINLHIDGKSTSVPEGSTFLDAIHKVGSHVPTLCYHPEFTPRAVCRIGLVDVEGSNKPVPSCRTKVKEGQIIHSNTQALKDFRRRDLQFLLSRHPNDCMRCEASGNCELQDLVQEEQVEDLWPKKERGSKEHPEHTLHDHTSPSIYRDMDKCIECGLCVDACAAQKITIRKSHENKQVQKLYKEMLGEPPERLLHTTYSARNSPRDRLNRFLSCVDHRDGKSASGLCSDDIIWDTNTSIFGAVCGKKDVQKLIEEKLPKIERKHSDELPRQRLISPIEGTDVRAPDGTEVHFDVKLDEEGRIQRVTRNRL